MLNDLRLALIGAGAMGEAIIGGLLRQALVPPGQIVATEPRAERRQELATRYQITLSDDNVAAARRADVLILAVKPQVLPHVLPPLRGTLAEHALCISIVAGVSLHTLVQNLGHTLVVRAMPNTPAQIGAGMTVWCATPEVGAEQLNWTRAVLGALGRELFVDDEQYLDMATAVSGSGPAYVFLIIEAMIDAGVHLGLPRHMAETLVTQTMLGSVQYAQQSTQHPAVLRNAVTSPAGTTAAALAALERGGVRAALSDAIHAAYQRSLELGQQHRQ